MFLLNEQKQFEQYLNSEDDRPLGTDDKESNSLRKRSMVKKGYVPQRGDVVWINLNPQSGHKQAGEVENPKTF